MSNELSTEQKEKRTKKYDYILVQVILWSVEIGAHIMGSNDFNFYVTNERPWRF